MAMILMMLPMRKRMGLYEVSTNTTSINMKHAEWEIGNEVKNRVQVMRKSSGKEEWEKKSSAISFF